MKAQELRIGNWVDIKSFNGNQGIVRTQFNYDLLRYIHLCEPIPLTPEILEKCGFEKMEREWYQKKYFTDCVEVAEEMEIVHNAKTKRCGVRDSDDDDNPYAMTGKIIKYLHQLQNLYFALTGEELEFKP